MIRCKKCILPDTASGVILDENGLCQLCKDYQSYIPKGHDELVREIQEFTLVDGDYNCVVPVSGGRDSAYALYYAHDILGLKTLAVHNDNDFETETARTNMDAMASNLGIPLIRISSKSKLSSKIVAEKFKMNAPFGPWIVVAETCEACEYGFRAATYNTAREKNVKLIIWGDSKDESTKSFYDLCQNHKTPTKWDRLKKPGIFNVIKYKYYFSRLKKEYGPNTSDGLKEIHLFDYIRWDRRVIIDTITKKLAWRAPADSPTTWRQDCSLIPLVDYLTYLANGVSKIEIGFSNMVRGGKMNRNDALIQIEQIKRNNDPDRLKMFLLNLNVSSSVIDQVLREQQHI